MALGAKRRKQEEVTRDVQSKDIRPIRKEPKKDETELIGIRFPKDDKETLRQHFKEQGVISVSVGIRQIIYNYMKKENLL